MSLREHALSLFYGAVGTIRPAPMLRRALKLQRGGCPQLLVKDQAFPVKRDLYLVGFGKAVLGMAAAAEEILGDHLTRGIINVPLGIQESLQRAGMQEMLLKPHSKIQVIEGAKNNLPDAEALKGAVAIQELAEGLTADDLLLVLISGGGSALLPAPIPPILLEEKEKLTKMLAARGAAIQELNIVRKTLSVLKGGGLAQLAHPAQVVSLILSDVIGDPLDIIASGPTAASSHSVQDCLQILTKYNLLHNLPKSVQTVLSSSPTKPTAPENYSHVSNIILGSNTVALEEAKRQAEGLGYAALVLSAAVQGEVGRVATLYCQLIQLLCLGFTSLREGPLSDELRGNLLQLAAELQIPGLDLEEFLQALRGLGPDRPVCILAGGETTVQLQGTGKGGRNQELALHVGLGLHKAQATGASSPQGRCEILFLSGGTDGQDGPTEAAGAFSSPGLVAEALQEGLDVEAFLRNNDSYTFFSQFQGGRHLLVTGLTGTNVMDIQAILIRAKERS
ncbi:glycerate kinase [Oenanthe melanoleuca]|uniref:glycerate kinase n=1 Tax=Oenanthe melanoleuca TaxID=2939378 RepID=UPI0024C1FFA1|nr:glycerate kinase [Oenanthe melanoleuca]XP_056357488.1 glycerate kinase [Oenanthe melanoleuca]XP_056357489.1 glycerate kinase [Oenanthe melanoleuca]XP_056357490.1 glycerate kinase [Oenanthe melanoleuca]XP_056357491.1 glycerate kinase [Oenanthe melanoleuca]